MIIQQLNPCPKTTINHIPDKNIKISEERTLYNIRYFGFSKYFKRRQIRHVKLISKYIAEKLNNKREFYREIFLEKLSEDCRKHISQTIRFEVYIVRSNICQYNIIHVVCKSA